MSNVHRVIHTEANCKDNVDAWDDVNGHAPKVEEANDISESADYDEDDHDADLDVTEKEKGDTKDADHG